MIYCSPKINRICNFEDDTTVSTVVIISKQHHRWQSLVLNMQVPNLKQTRRKHDNTWVKLDEDKIRDNNFVKLLNVCIDKKLKFYDYILNKCSN